MQKFTKLTKYYVYLKRKCIFCLKWNHTNNNNNDNNIPTYFPENLHVQINDGKDNTKELYSRVETTMQIKM